MGIAAQQNRLSDDLRIGRKAAGPKAIAEHDDLNALGQIFLRRESATADGHRAEQLEEIGAHLGGLASSPGKPPPVRFTTPVRNAETSPTTSVCSRQCRNFAGDAPGPEPWGDVFMKSTSRSESGNGAGFSKTEFTIEKIAVFAPIPIVSAVTAAAVNPGLCRKRRREYWTSWRSVSMGF